MGKKLLKVAPLKRLKSFLSVKKSVQACSKVSEQTSGSCSMHDPISLSSDKSVVLLKLVVK